MTTKMPSTEKVPQDAARDAAAASYGVTVTYSPQDDKLRVYFATRQGEDVLESLKAAGFRWAGAQECWFAVWSPAREDAALATGADGIDDEPSSLEDRAEARGERFQGYSKSNRQEAESRWKRDRQLSEQLNGQPILIGHHSEKGHRAMLARAWRNFHKAGEANQRADYWAARAGAGVKWAQYKEKPGVRARRIKTLEAESRKVKRSIEASELCLKVFDHGKAFADLKSAANYGTAFGIAYGAWSRLCKCEEMDPMTSAAEVRLIIDDVRAGATANVARCQRWVDHLAGRIAYERAQLAEQGADHLLDPKPRRAGKAAVPLRNVPGALVVVTLTDAPMHKVKPS